MRLDLLRARLASMEGRLARFWRLPFKLRDGPLSKVMGPCRWKQEQVHFPWTRRLCELSQVLAFLMSFREWLW